MREKEAPPKPTLSVDMAEYRKMQKRMVKVQDEARVGKRPPQAPPEKESIRKKLRDMEAEAKRRNDTRRQQTRPRRHDYDRGR